MQGTNRIEQSRIGAWVRLVFMASILKQKNAESRIRDSNKYSSEERGGPKPVSSSVLYRLSIKGIESLQYKHRLGTLLALTWNVEANLIIFFRIPRTK